MSEEAKPTLDVDQIKKDPRRHFSSPERVLAADLSRQEKIEILRQWRYDAAEMKVATEEGMDGGESPRLAELDALLRELEDSREGTAAKQGVA